MLKTEKNNSNLFKNEKELKPISILSRFHSCFLYNHSICVTMSHLDIDARNMTLNET